MSKGEIFGLVGLAFSALGGIFAFKADKTDKEEMKEEIKQELKKELTKESEFEKEPVETAE